MTGEAPPGLVANGPSKGLPASRLPSQHPQPAVASPATAGVPPRLVGVLALAVCVAGVVITLLGAWRVGISTDEPVHVLRYENLQQHGWYLLDDDFHGDAPGDWVTDRYVYGPVFTQLSHVVNRVLGLDPDGALGTSVDAYVARHLLVAVCGLLGVLAVAALARRVLGSWRWGAVAAATLLAVPMWPGLSMFDMKDVPPATGYTLVTLALVESLAVGRASTRWRSVWHVLLLVAGIVLVVGTRPGLWPGIAASLGVAGLLALRRTEGSAGRSWPRLLAEVAAAGAVAYAVLLLCYPAYFSRPDEWLLDSVLNSADYAGRPGGDTSGSWAYLPTRVLLLVPTLLLLGGALGCVTGAPRRLPRLTPEVGAWLLVLTQGLLLPVLAIVRQSLLYDGLRQVLFALPAVALMLTWGWRRVAADVGGGSRGAAGVMGVLWSAALLVPVAVQVQIFPFAYSYTAPWAAPLGVAPENDYWRVSYRELLDQVPRDEFVVCYPDLSPSGDTLRMLPATGRPLAESSADCRTHPASTITPFGLASTDPDPYRVEDTFVALFNRDQLPGHNCTQVGDVERRLYLTTQVMSRVARCELVLEPYPEEGVRFDPDGTGAAYLLGGWTAHPDLPGVQLVAERGSLGFQLPEDWAGRAILVRLEGLDPGDASPEVWVNNEPVTVTREESGWEAVAPADAVAVLGQRRLAVTMTAPEPGSDLILTGVRVEPAAG